MLPPTLYADLPDTVRAVVLRDGTCVFNALRPRASGLMLHFTDRVVDNERVLAMILGRG